MCNNQLNKCSLGHITTTKVLLCLFLLSAATSPSVLSERNLDEYSLRVSHVVHLWSEITCWCGIFKSFIKKKHASGSGGARVLYSFWPFPSSVAFNQAWTGKCFRRETLSHTHTLVLKWCRCRDCGFVEQSYVGMLEVPLHERKLLFHELLMEFVYVPFRIIRVRVTSLLNVELSNWFNRCYNIYLTELSATNKY
jgi:hypothetical protein